MPCARLPLLVSSILLLTAATAAAQHPSAPAPLPSADTVVIEALTPEQERELASWLSDMHAWRDDEMKWKNRPRRDGWGRISARRPAPEAPPWLESYCARNAAAGVPALDACRLLADPRAETGVIPARATVPDDEKPKKSSFLRRVHLDGLWSTTSTQGRVYGLVGTHVSVVDVGRLQIFGPPGVLLVSVPSVAGTRRITIGYTWGVSLRLADTRLFGTKDMTLFLNVSKVWVGGGGGQGLDIIGFSLAPRNKK